LSEIKSVNLKKKNIELSLFTKRVLIVWHQFITYVHFAALNSRWRKKAEIDQTFPMTELLRMYYFGGHYTLLIKIAERFFFLAAFLRRSARQHPL
jgi:hypothetical protein